MSSKNLLTEEQLTLHFDKSNRLVFSIDVTKKSIYAVRLRRLAQGNHPLRVGSVTWEWTPENWDRFAGTIMANHLAANYLSARLLQKLGFTRECVAKDYLKINGAWRDHVLNSLTNHDWTEM